MWFIFQSSVIFAVVASDIHWHWNSERIPRECNRDWAGLRPDAATDRSSDLALRQD